MWEARSYRTCQHYITVVCTALVAWAPAICLPLSPTVSLVVAFDTPVDAKVAATRAPMAFVLSATVSSACPTF